MTVLEDALRRTRARRDSAAALSLSLAARGLLERADQLGLIALRIHTRACAIEDKIAERSGGPAICPTCGVDARTVTIASSCECEVDP